MAKALATRLARIEDRRAPPTRYIVVSSYPGLEHSEVNRLWFGAGFVPPRGVNVIYVTDDPSFDMRHREGSSSVPPIPHSFAEDRTHVMFPTWWKTAVDWFDARRAAVKAATGLDLVEFDHAAYDPASLASEGLQAKLAAFEHVEEPPMFTDPPRRGE